MDESTPTLYEWAGGAEAFHRLINAFYDRVEADDRLSGFFPGGVSVEHRDHVQRWWIEVMGGPADYTALGAPVPRWGWGVAPPYVG